MSKITNKKINQKFLQGSRGRFFQKESPGRRRQKRKEYFEKLAKDWDDEHHTPLIYRVSYENKPRRHIKGRREEKIEIIYENPKKITNTSFY